MSDYQKVRALINDGQGVIFSDEILEPFIQQAEAFTPIIAAYFIAISRGAFATAEQFLSFLPKRLEGQSAFHVVKEGELNA